MTGGVYNYKYQSKALIAGVAKEAKVDWKVVNEGGSGTRAQIALYDNPSWAKGHDVVVRNECFANTADEAYIRKITKVHKAGVPAVVITARCTHTVLLRLMSGESFSESQVAGTITRAATR